MIPTFLSDPGEQHCIHYSVILCVCSTGFLRAPILQSLSLSFVRPPFHIHKHPFLYVLNLKLTDFLTPIIQVWIFCPVALEFSTLQISVTLDRFVWILSLHIIYLRDFPPKQEKMSNPLQSFWSVCSQCKAQGCSSPPPLKTICKANRINVWKESATPFH